MLHRWIGGKYSFSLKTQLRVQRKEPCGWKLHLQRSENVPHRNGRRYEVRPDDSLTNLSNTSYRNAQETPTNLEWACKCNGGTLVFRALTIHLAIVDWKQGIHFQTLLASQKICSIVRGCAFQTGHIQTMKSNIFGVLSSRTQGWTMSSLRWKPNILERQEDLEHKITLSQWRIRMGTLQEGHQLGKTSDRCDGHQSRPLCRRDHLRRVPWWIHRVVSAEKNQTHSKEARGCCHWGLICKTPWMNVLKSEANKGFKNRMEKSDPQSPPRF